MFLRIILYNHSDRMNQQGIVTRILFLTTEKSNAKQLKEETIAKKIISHCAIDIIFYAIASIATSFFYPEV